MTCVAIGFLFTVPLTISEGLVRIWGDNWPEPFDRIGFGESCHALGGSLRFNGSSQFNGMLDRRELVGV